MKADETPLTTPQRKEIEHVHRCPQCDRFKRVIRENARRIYESLRFDRPGGLSPHEALSLRDSIWHALWGITRAIDPDQARLVQKMTDDEATEYLAESFLEPHWKPPLHAPVSAGEEAGQRPNLTLIQGGLSHAR